MLNQLGPAQGEKKHRIRKGRGQAKKGKTCGRGHKGYLSRSGSKRKIGFEGGQMPLKQRLPKVGFKSLKAQTRAEVRLYQINKLQEEVVDISVLKRRNVIPYAIETVKVILKGELTRPVILRGLLVSQQAKEAIERAGGRVE